MTRLLAVLLALLALVVAAAPVANAQHRPSQWPDDPQAGQTITDPDDDETGDVPDDAGDPQDEDEGAGEEDPDWPWPPEVPDVVTTTLKSIKGKVARMRVDGKAAIPQGAPVAVRAILRAANDIVGKPYKWGGGHQQLRDSGYDCSGSVSYALIKAGKLRSPLVSGDLAKTFAAGAGRHVTVYANKGHVYMEVAGLRLDTSSVGDPGGRKGVRWRPLIGKRDGFKRRHPVGL
ncbi:hypothetical protein [Paraconexibacter sp. AEG42_29]